ncbi:hypothetical protein [Calidithermus timidus]|uniref:hypothetical protein n=1 Tax=Calidithermus timidus TaxID=307124 RepID=UPI000377399A|nr:hypothetical protein [Calidithermus timidus]
MRRLLIALNFAFLVACAQVGGPPRFFPAHRFGLEVVQEGEGLPLEVVRAAGLLALTAPPGLCAV